MKIRILSDIHYEFHRDGGRAFTDALDPSGCDALVLAGDISNAKGITNALEMLCDRFKDVPVMFVMGNHEYYGSGRVAARACVSLAKAKNLVVLQGTRNGRFLGDTLWFAHRPDAPRWAMNDFDQIAGLDHWVHDDNHCTEEFLWDAMRPGDIVVTHHLPSPQCVHPRYKGSPLNAFFVHDLTRLIETRRPALWIHGHTHMSVDTTIGATRVVCNPFGYLGRETNARFDAQFTVEVA